MTTIGFIGLGHMGHPMAENCLKHYPVMVYDVMPEAITSMTQLGAKGARDITEIASECDVIFTMLQNGEQVKDVCTRENGLFNHAKKNTLFIDSSSIDIQTARDLNSRAKQLGFAMLDAPVSGGVNGAKAGTLTMMVGGDADDFAKAKPFLECVGKNIVHAGIAGNGQVAKICNNMLLGISMIGVCETFTLGEKLGLAPSTLFAISSKASGQCWSMTSYSPVPGLVENAPSNNDYRPGFTAAMMLKDLKLSQNAAQLAQMPTPLGALATQLYEQFVALDHGQMDFSGIIKMLAK